MGACAHSSPSRAIPARAHWILHGGPFSAGRARGAGGRRRGEAGHPARDGGTYGHVDGPRFNTPSEIAELARCGVTAVSQTAGPETVLCGELELPFALIGFVTDYANEVMPGEPTPVAKMIELMGQSTAIFADVLRGAPGQARRRRRPVRRARSTASERHERDGARRPDHGARPAARGGPARARAAARRRRLRRAAVGADRAVVVVGAGGGAGGDSRRSRPARRRAASCARSSAPTRRCSRRTATGSPAGWPTRSARVFARNDGPLLIVWPDLPQAATRPCRPARSSDLAAGCDVVFGPVIDGGLYMIALGRPLPKLFALPEQAWRSPDVMMLGVAAAREAGLEIGILRAERALQRPADVRAALADPLLPDELAAILKRAA